MRSKTAFVLVLAGSLWLPAALADDTPIDIKTDLDGQYFLVEKGGTADMPILVVKRSGPGFNHYIKREFDCAAHTERYLGEGESLEEMNASEPNADASSISEGTIPDQLSRLVCPKG